MQPKTTFTPGPWLVDPRFPDSIRAADGTTLFVGTTDNARKFANAHLIAAAPDLYAALIAILQDSDVLSERQFGMAAEAVARARGEG